jgi:ubiquinone/menaquinone biosynthesis C-methylase UbiE
MLSPIQRLDYAARQGARVAWYMGHYFASQDFRKAKPKPANDVAKPAAPPPGLKRIFEEMGALFARDLANVEAGLYPAPRDRGGSLKELVDTSRRFFADIPVSAERKSEKRGTEVYSPELAEELPAYFLQNFHFQTGGYLTEDSAKLYDMQVEVLFSGTANAMRRQCLAPVAEYLKGRDQRKVKLLDVACGTGRFARALKQAFPRLDVTASDLSAAYLEEAKRHIAPYRADYRVAKAEALPFDDGSFDILSCIYLFHEVPPKVRREIAVEFARVLKPGGRLVFMDSAQKGDTPGFDGLLDSFPLNFHEPFYRSYLAEDLAEMFASAGFRHVRMEPQFMSKLLVFERDSALTVSKP